MPKKLKKLDKRGVDLTLNTIIIAVLVVLVLVVVIVFFIGGFRGLTDRIKATFFGTTAGTDEVLAVQACEQYCEQAKLLPKERGTKTGELIKRSAYCTNAFVIDGRSIKVGDKYSLVFVCGSDHGDETAIGDKYGALNVDSLGIACPEISCK